MSLDTHTIPLMDCPIPQRNNQSVEQGRCSLLRIIVHCTARPGCNMTVEDFQTNFFMGYISIMSVMLP